MSYSTLLDLAGIVVLVIGSVAYYTSSRRKVSDEAATELISKLTALREADKEEFSNRLKCLEDQHLEDAKLMAHMQGQIATYKDVPLRELSDSLKTIAVDIKISTDAQNEILKTLRSSALIAAEDRAFLTTPKNQNIETQTVQNQTINKRA